MQSDDEDEAPSPSQRQYMHTWSLPPIHHGFVPSDPRAKPVTPEPSGSNSEARWTIGGWNKGLRKAHEPPSDEFNDLYAAALSAFLDIETDGPDKAFDLIQQAIAVNPEVNAAHVLLSNIYSAKGDDERAVAALFTGAHADSREPETWRRVAEACMDRAASNHEMRVTEARYCYTRMLELNSKDHETRFKRSNTNRELGFHKKALRDLDILLKYMPHNPSVLRQIAEICVETRQTARAKKRYEACIEYNKSSGKVCEDTFSFSDVLYYVELFATLAEYDEAIFLLKKLARWLVGREEEQYWDRFEDDDREWDAEDRPRREDVQDYAPGKFPNDMYGDSLPMELRVRLGTYRLQQGAPHFEEAFGHFEWLEPDDEGDGAHIEQFPDLFLEAGMALTKAHCHEQALRYLEPLKRTDALVDTAAWLAIAQSSYVCGRRNQALQCYEAAKSMDPQCSESRYQLSKLYKDVGNREKAIRNAKEATMLRQHSVRTPDRRQYERKDQRLAREAAEKALKEARMLPGPREASPVLSGHPEFDFESSQTVWQIDVTSGSPFSTAKLNQPRRKMRAFKRKQQARLTQEEEERARLAKVTRDYVSLVNCTESMRAGDQVSIRLWMQCAEALVKDFRRNKVFYPYERHITFQGYDREARASTFRKKWQKEKKVRSNPYRRAPIDSADPDPDPDPDIPFPSIESTVPTDYISISFAAWLDIFLEYALLLAKITRDKDDCYQIITAALDCTVWYHSPADMLQIYTTWFVCALVLGDPNTLFNTVARWFMRQYQFCTDTYRLFSALNLVYDYPNVHGGKDGQMLNAVFRLGPSQKFLFRQVKAVDALLPSDYDGGDEGPLPAFMREELSRLTREEQEDSAKREGGGFPGFSERQIRPKQMDVVLLTLYGHILYAGGSYPNALSYFYRANALDPGNPTVLLSISLSYVHQMFKRQNENRHQYLLEGMAFFQEYADAKLEWAKKQDRKTDEIEMQQDGQMGTTEKVVRQEIEFNRARMWQMLGMSDLSLTGYGKVLKDMLGKRAGEVDEVVGDGTEEVQAENFSMEAAYAMQLIYAVNGDTATAKQVTDKWLVVE